MTTSRPPLRAGGRQPARGGEQPCRLPKVVAPRPVHIGWDALWCEWNMTRGQQAIPTHTRCSHTPDCITAQPGTPRLQPPPTWRIGRSVHFLLPTCSWCRKLVQLPTHLEHWPQSAHPAAPPAVPLPGWPRQWAAPPAPPWSARHTKQMDGLLLQAGPVAGCFRKSAAASTAG